MIGILVVTHGEFGNELIKSSQMIVGEQQQISSLSLMPGDDIEELYSNALIEINALDNGDGVIIFTDLFGGTPSNTVLRTIVEKNAWLVTGVNLPMLLETLILRVSVSSLESLVKQCIKEAHSGIANISGKQLN